MLPNPTARTPYGSGPGNEVTTLGRRLRAFFANIAQQVVGYLQHRRGTPVQRAFGILYGGIGVGLEVGLPRHRLSTAVRGLITRYVFSITLATLVWFFLPYAHQVKVVVVLVLFAPIAAMVPGFNSEVDGHVGTATFMNSVTILIAIVMMPTLYLLLNAYV